MSSYLQNLVTRLLGSHLALMGLCVALVAGMFLATGGEASAAGLGGLLLPLLLCLAMHGLMHHFMGHGATEGRPQVEPRPAPVPDRADRP
jgi:hypothetical protein